MTVVYGPNDPNDPRNMPAMSQDQFNQGEQRFGPSGYSYDQYLNTPGNFNPNLPAQTGQSLPPSYGLSQPSLIGQNPGIQDFKNYFTSRGVSDNEAPYWASKWNELNQRGQQLGNPNYANRFLSNAEVFTGSPEATAQNMWGSSNNSNSNPSMFNPQMWMQMLSQMMGQNQNMPIQKQGQSHNISNYFQNKGMTPTGQTDGTMIGTSMSPNWVSNVGEPGINQKDSWSIGGQKPMVQPNTNNSRSLNPFGNQNPMGAPSFYKQPAPGGVQNQSKFGGMGF